jgi:hypothetical protein
MSEKSVIASTPKVVVAFNANYLFELDTRSPHGATLSIGNSTYDKDHESQT